MESGLQDYSFSTAEPTESFSFELDGHTFSGQTSLLSVTTSGRVTLRDLSQFPGLH